MADERVMREATEAARKAGSGNLPLPVEFPRITALSVLAPFRSPDQLSLFSSGFSYTSLSSATWGVLPPDVVDKVVAGNLSDQDAVAASAKANEEILSSFFGPDGVDIPNSSELGRFLASVNGESFFSPTQEPDGDFVRSQVDACLQALKLENIPPVLTRRALTINRDSGDLRNSSAWKRAKESMLLVGERSGRSAAQEEAKSAAEAFIHAALWEPQRDYPRLPLRTIAKRHREAPEIIAEITEDVQLAGQWIVVQDLMHQESFTGGNPFIHKVELDRLGLVRTNVTGSTPESRKLIITIPAILQAA